MTLFLQNVYRLIFIELKSTVLHIKKYRKIKLV